ncbi:MAG TPA: AraC family transcriptional regulator [Chitinophagaceae bacterium]|nr:AraC family transcriptional regulator [Chitinophagaceae bacterium]
MVNETYHKQQLTKIFKTPFYCGIINHASLDGKVVGSQHEAFTDKSVTIPARADDKIEDASVKKVREAVGAHLSGYDFTVEQLCKYVFMSHSQLHRKLEALTGCSPNKFIRIIRLNKAKELLKDPENSIAGIALDCGYNDAGYFSRVFKQENYVTPQEWRVKNKVELT